MPTAIAVTSPELVLPSPDRHTPTAAVLQSAVQAARAHTGKGYVAKSAATKASTRGSGKASGKAQASQEQSLDQALTEMHTLIEHHGYVIVLCPSSAPPAVLHRLIRICINHDPNFSGSSHRTSDR